MQAIVLSLPPHLGQVSISMAKTLFKRCIQVMGARGLSLVFSLGSRFGTTCARCLLLGANTPVEAGEVQARTRYESCEPSDEIQGVEHDVGGAVVERLLELVDDLFSFVGRQPFVRDGGSGDIAAEFFQLVALIGLTAGRRVERKARLPGEQG